MNNFDDLTLQQQRFCDEYLVSFNAFRAALSAGYSENTARKAELLHNPKIQAYLKLGMEKARERLEITHDMILRELAKVAFSNMGNYYDDRSALKPMYALTSDEKAALSYYQVCDTYDQDGNRTGELGKIKLHNKMSALDKIARHVGFYREKTQESRAKNQDFFTEQKAESEKPRAFGEETEELRAKNQDEEVKGEGLKDKGFEEREAGNVKQDVFVEVQKLEAAVPTTEQLVVNDNEELINDLTLTANPAESETKARLADKDAEAGKTLTLSPLPGTRVEMQEPIKPVEKPRHWLWLGNG